ncbi:5'-methylthioadenosine/S-adenosylhomocysteine nucleosidase [Ureaplasma ceti]|uniref:adenosylhomocysteine nucleosidase n=1 Tax=Ureaplasma ceti TaxID=3119530 RepID=A0ABP9U5C7_9BACT
MLGIIVALDYETDKIAQNARKITKHNQVFYQLNDSVVLTFSGIGKVNAAASCMNLINNFKIDAIINVGTSGSCNATINPLDVVLVQNNVYGDVDVTIDDSYAMNQMPRETKFFKTNEELTQTLGGLLTQLNIPFKAGNCMTIDSFVTKKNYMKFNELEDVQAYAVDMESVALAQVCQHTQTPFGCVKFVSDVFDSKNNHDDFLKNVQTISVWIDQLLSEMIKTWEVKHG